MTTPSQTQARPQDITLAADANDQMYQESSFGDKGE
jgi:hypothetical protein